MLRGEKPIAAIRNGVLGPIHEARIDLGELVGQREGDMGLCQDTASEREVWVLNQMSLVLPGREF